MIMNPKIISGFQQWVMEEIWLTNHQQIICSNMELAKMSEQCSSTRLPQRWCVSFQNANHFRNASKNSLIFLNQCDEFIHNHVILNPMIFTTENGRMFLSMPIKFDRRRIHEYRDPLGWFHLLFSE
jgi:hypothetical protein